MNPYQSTQELILTLGRVTNPFEGPLWRDIFAGREDMASSTTYDMADSEIITRFGIYQAIKEDSRPDHYSNLVIL